MAFGNESIRAGWKEAVGLFLLVLCALFLLSVASYDPGDISVLHSPANHPPANFIGAAGAWVAFATFMLLGVAGYLVPVCVGVQGLFLLFKREGRTWPKALWMAIILIALVCLVELQGDLWAPLGSRLNIGNVGGILGHLLADGLLIRFLGVIGTGILAAGLMVVALIVLFEIQPIAFMRQLGSWSSSLYGKVDAVVAEHRDRRAQIEHEEKELARQRKRLERAVRTRDPVLPQTAREEKERIIKSRETAAGIEPEPAEEKKSILPRRRKPEPVAPKKPSPPPPPISHEPSDYKLPSIDLLAQPPPTAQREIKGDFQQSATILQETLAEFGIEAQVTNVQRGPVVTRYEILPAAGIRVEKIVGLSNNIALAMKAESVRIQAPIPGKGVVGIEVPNSTTTMVFLREMMESERWKTSSAALPLVLGKDVSGKEIIADLAEMPHMLIAGATGSGKTVCMNSILAGLLMSRTPDQMRLLLVDPKIVEFSAFNNLPHLVVPVVTQAKKVNLGLRWAITEMENRYKLFAKVGVRNIAAYNTRPIAKQEELFGGEVPAEENAKKPPDRLPYIVIIVDELADLMLVAQAEIENSIARLAQLSRAVGIHMILATQRPSVNVITGTIKANFPARVAFQVAQKIDSRTILDANGADKLLGKGDMLFLPPGSPKLIRAQGTLTNDQEIRDITDFWRAQGDPQFEVAIKEKIESKAVEIPDQEEDDDILETAIEIIRQTRRASTSSLQRRLRIGYTRAARLMDILEERGIVGPPCGSDPREILIDLDGEIPQNEEDI